MKKAMKKFIHRFIVDEKGAVSIFLIMITLLLFIFNAVLIDFARIIIAERQTEEAANVALRSTMSSYHQKLQDAGLFAFDGDEGEATAIFKEVFEKNISPNEAGNFELLGLRSEDSEMTLDLNFDRSLGNKEALRYQILEEMKYKAPVEVGEAILKNFLSISEKVEDASNYSKVAKEVNELAEERMEKLEEAKELLEDAQNLLNGVNAIVTRGGPDGSYPDIKTTYDIYHYHHENYLKDLKAIEEAENADKDEDIDESDIENKKSDTKTFKENAEKILQAILNAANPAFDKIVEAIDLIQEAKDLNDDIVSTINAPENTTGEDYTNANNLAERGIDGSVDDSTLVDFIMDDSFFTNLNQVLNDAKRSLKVESGPQTNALITKVGQEFLPLVQNDFSPRDPRLVERHKDHTVDYYDDSISKVTEALDIIEEGFSEYLSDEDTTSDEMEEKLDEQENNAETDMENTDELMDDLLDSIGESSVDNAKLIELNGLATTYGEASATNEQEFSMEDADDTSDQAMSFIDIIFKGIGDALIGARDEVYINEYILMRFKSHDFKEESAARYSFANNQVEYIIYGQEQYGMNHFAAMSEIFAVRFAIRLTDALIKPANKVFGPLFWATALADAFAQTFVDMDDINKGRSVELFPGLKNDKGRTLRMDYKDHLRLFLFIHPEGGKFHRLMAVLHDGTEQDLRESSTYVTAEATTSIKLWFLPQIADLLGRAEVINGRVEGNRFFIEKEVHYSY